MKRLVIGGIVPILALLVSPARASPASAQSEGSLAISAYNCETNPPGIPQDLFDVPSENCAAAPGATITVTDASGEIAGGCTIASGDRHCGVQLPVGATVTVTEEPATIPAGYAPRENPIVYTMPPPGSDGQFFVVFLNVRQAADDGPDNGATTLPTTGAGTAAGVDARSSMLWAATVLLATLGGAVILRARSFASVERGGR